MEAVKERKRLVKDIRANLKGSGHVSIFHSKATVGKSSHIEVVAGCVVRP
jgi:hypothetical protein